AFARGNDRALWHNRQTNASGNWFGWESLGLPMWPLSDRRRITVVELARPPLRLSGQKYPETITGAVVSVPVAQLPALQSDRTIILDDDQARPHTARVTTATTAGDQLMVGFTPGLTRSLKTSMAVMYANVALATHGEPVGPEILGGGDASAR